MLTRFKERVLKKNFHTSWLAVPPPSSLCSLPVCPKGRFALEGEKKTLGDEKLAARWGCWPVTFVQTQLLCVYTHGEGSDASVSAAVPEGEQSVQCLQAAQLDPAAELDRSWI